MYKGKTVLITGESRGVGLGLGLYFLENNATVIGLSRVCPESLCNLPGVSDIPIEMTNVHSFIWNNCDLSDIDSIMGVFQMLTEQKIKIDICINNAAVLTSQYILKMPLQKITDMVNVNLIAPILVSREAAKLMRNEYGRIINISSMAVALEPQGDSVYAAAKAGLNIFTNIIAKELNFMNITCNTLAISAIETDMLKQLNKEKVDTVIARLPIPRYAKMEDITNVIDFFCSKKSNYVTSQTIYLGGVHR